MESWEQVWLRKRKLRSKILSENRCIEGFGSRTFDRTEERGVYDYYGHKMSWKNNGNDQLVSRTYTEYKDGTRQRSLERSQLESLTSWHMKWTRNRSFPVRNGGPDNSRKGKGLLCGIRKRMRKVHTWVNTFLNILTKNTVMIMKRNRKSDKRPVTNKVLVQQFIIKN